MTRTLAIIIDNRTITQTELKDKLEILLMSVKRVMKTLQEKKKIERVGSSGKGYWKDIK